MNKEIVIPVSELKKALLGLSKIVRKARSLPVLQSVRVARDLDGKLSIQANDLDSCATYTFKEAQAGPAVELLMPLDQLTKTVKSVKEGTIGLTPDGKEKVKLRYSIGGNVVEQNVTTPSVAEFPPEPKVNQPSMPLEAGFGLALRQALESCSEDSSRRILNGACLDVTDKKFHYVVGTNGRSLFSANSFCFDLKKSVVIPDSKFLEWTDFMDEEPASLSMEPGEEEQPAKNGKPAKEATPGWVKLESGQRSFITKEIEGKYPNWKQVIPTTNGKWARVHLSDQSVKQRLLITPNLPGDGGVNHPARLRVTANQLNVEGQNKDAGDWTSIPVDAVVTGNPVNVAINRHYLLNALRFGLNQLEIEDPLSPVVFSNGGKKMVIMPVNLEGPVTVQPAAQPPSEVITPATEQTAPPANIGATTEERKDMPRTARAPEAVIPRVQTAETNNNGNGSATKTLVDHVEQIKESLKAAIRDLASLADLVKAAEKEKRTSEKEIEAIRTKLRQIQNVTI